MVTYIGLVLAILVSGCSDRSQVKVLGPAIVRVGTSYELALPQTMGDAIEQAVPGFEVEALASYDAAVQRYYPITGRQLPWAVVADFNGDGAQDLVVDGHVGAAFYRLAVWGGSSAVDMGLELPRRQRGEKYDSVLLYSPPGEHFSWENEETVHMFSDGYVDYLFEQAGVTYYWENAQWRSYTSSD